MLKPRARTSQPRVQPNDVQTRNETSGKQNSKTRTKAQRTKRHWKRRNSRNSRVTLWPAEPESSLEPRTTIPGVPRQAHFTESHKDRLQGTPFTASHAWPCNTRLHARRRCPPKKRRWEDLRTRARSTDSGWYSPRQAVIARLADPGAELNG